MGHVGQGMNGTYALHLLDSGLVLSLHGSLTDAEIQELKRKISQYSKMAANSFRIDVSNVSYVDSTTLGFFAWLHLFFEERAVKIHFLGANEQLINIFQIVGFVDYSTVFKFDDTATVLRENLEEKRTSQRKSMDGATLNIGTVRKVAYKMFFPSDNELSSMRQFLDDFLYQSNIDDETAGDIRVAAGEVFANAITHGARGVEDPYTRVEILQYHSALVVEVFDNGRAFTGNFEPSSEVFRTNGRGILLMRELADTIEFIPEPSRFDKRGTLVRIMKRLD